MIIVTIMVYYLNQMIKYLELFQKLNAIFGGSEQS